MHEDTLARAALFNSLDKKELQALASECQERSFDTGATIIKQDTSGTGLYIITSGHGKIVKEHGPDRAEEELGTFGPGSVIGEMALLDDLPRSANVVATEPVVALVLPVWAFRGTVRNHPEIAIKLLSVLSKRLRKLESKDDQ
ncbi:MAG TPA: cyclic nucleotide-binding domain-containing protein [Ktedonobacteraceae bacterium]|nr:cyclic nucleotide-binding domain-containing protein [Ktedonobacteraceae bacterium]